MPKTANARSTPAAGSARTGSGDLARSGLARPHRPLRVIVPLVLLATAALAQAPPQSDLRSMALEWALGRYASPVFCDFGGEPVSGIRRVEIEPPRRAEREPVAQIVFVDIEAEKASRCFDALGGDQRNLVGRLKIRFDGRARADTAAYDFRQALRRDGGFDFQIVSGGLRIAPVSSSREAWPAPVDFRGGRARLHEIGPGSDAAKLLKGYPSPRKRLLEIESRSGERFSLPLFLAEMP